MKCPRDGEELQPQLYWQHPRHKCPKCTGFLVSEAGVLEALGRTGDKTFGESAGSKVAALPQSSLLCARDGKPMHVFTYQGVELDICPACRSLWLDRGEHAKVALLRKDPPGTRIGNSTVDAADVGEAAFEFVGEALGALFSW